MLLTAHWVTRRLCRLVRDIHSPEVGTGIERDRGVTGHIELDGR